MPNILIVDDSVSVLKALEITLRNHDMSSISASSGEDALAVLSAAGHEPCDLMMVDVIMPGISGVELCRQIKTDPRHANLPIILMSGHVNDEVRVQAREVGADGVLCKPFRSDELIPILRGVMAEYRTQALTVSEDDDDAVLLADFAVAPAAAPAASVNHEPLNHLTDMLRHYANQPRVHDVMILDRQGQPIKQTANVLPENIQLFTRFFTTTAGVMGQQLFGEDITQVSIRYGTQEMVVHNLPAYFVVVLMGQDHAANALQA